MFKYLKAALFARMTVPLLGAVPFNIVIGLAFAVLGVFQPAFFLLGAGVVGALTFALSSSERFRKVIDAQDFAEIQVRTAAQRATLISSMKGSYRQRLTALESRCAKIIQTYRAARLDDVSIAANVEALDKLKWLYLKLLVAHQTLAEHADDATERAVRSEIAEIEQDLKSDKLPQGLRTSRSATLELLQKRLGKLERRKQSMDELESDLQRIETQVDLAMDDATLTGTPAAISTNIELVSHMLDSGLLGQSSDDLLSMEYPADDALPQPLAENDAPATPSADSARAGGPKPPPIPRQSRPPLAEEKQ